mmetsp:Transcript_10686/g.15731  ORF Transcript_10686/g.15731 Transcript_10686/m.15731 type:complete len:122 (-) Transcript_10686:72-437(-)
MAVEMYSPAAALMAQVMQQQTLKTISGKTKNRIYTLNALVRAFGEVMIPKNKAKQKRAETADIVDQSIHMSLASPSDGPAMKRSYRVEFSFSSEAFNISIADLCILVIEVLFVKKLMVALL